MRVSHMVRIVLNLYRGPTVDGFFRGAHGPDGEPLQEFLEYRCDLLNRYTLRSLAAQTSQDFHILVLHDHRSSPAALIDRGVFGDRIHMLGLEPIDFRPRMTDAFWKRHKDEDELVHALSTGSDRILVTYIDSDDCYRRDAIKMFADRAAHDGVLTTNTGYIHNTHTQAVREHAWVSPPFFSLAYDASEYRRGLRINGGACNHSNMATAAPALRIRERLWMLTIHGSNDSSGWGAATGRKLGAAEALGVRCSFGLGCDSMGG